MKLVWNPALTLDGYIARRNGDSDWVADADSESFRNLIRESGCVIVGRTTYEQYKGDVFPVPGATTFVLTSHLEDSVAEDGVEFVRVSPQELLVRLEKRGFDRAILAGGSATNSRFAGAGLIDEIIANIYPMAFGDGMKLLSGCELVLELTDVRQLPGGIVQHWYTVVK
ncbi:MAG: dihydrofolate reductase family protein [Candidatus Micrarchaeaceae archaeon]